MKIRVLIADDDALIREGLKIILQTDERFEVAACVDNGLQALDCCRQNKIDIALLDVRMPVMDGLQAAMRISGETETKPLILTTFDDDSFIMEAVKNGARGYLLKNNSPSKIMDAIKMVWEGGIVMQDVAMDKIKDLLSEPKRHSIPEDLFSERELDIIRLIARGLSNKDISKELFLTEGTVKNYISSILNKTGLEHRTQIAIYYLTGSRCAN